MGWLLLLIAVVLVVYLFSRSSGTKSSTHDELTSRNREWVEFITGYKKQAKTKDQKQLIDKMLSDIASQGLGASAEYIGEPTSYAFSSKAAAQVVQPAVTLSSEKTPAESSTPKSQIQLNNASLLLYFGAFLFVASASLFVVFAGIAGSLRASIVVIVAAVMYGGGVWLYKNNTKLQQAGLAFAGIGIAIVPLIGLAAYKYVFNQDHGSEVWFGTSILCLALYAHALFVLRKPLINYIFILTFLSLFESSVSIINVPIYYFGWALAALGLILTGVSRYKGIWPEMQQSSRLSGSVLLPISVLVSIVLVPNHGAFQMGVSLLLAAIYYGFEAIATKAGMQESNAIVAHIIGLVGIASIVYSVSNSWAATASGLIILAAAQTLAIFVLPLANNLSRNYASVTIVSAVAAIFAGIQHPALTLGAAAVVAATSAVVWLRQDRIDAYAVSAAALMALPFVYGQYLSNPHLNGSIQALLFLAALAVQLGVILVRNKRFEDSEIFTVHLVYVVSSLAVVGSAYWARPVLGLVISALVAASMISIARRQKNSEWAETAGIFILAPLLWTWNEPGIFLSTILASLILNIILSLTYRKEINRWLSTALWLLLPRGLGDVNVFTHWNSGIYAWAYLLAMIGLVFSRSIALGTILLSAKIPMASLAKTASLSYVSGYWLSGILSVGLAFSYGNHLETSLIISGVTVIVWGLSNFIEKQPDLLALIPALLQLLVISIIHPDSDGKNIIAFTVISTVLAAATYFIVYITTSSKEKITAVQNGALVMLFVTPLSYLLTSHTYWPMPAGLLIASLIVFYHLRNYTQENKEMAGGLVILSIFWLMHFLGVRQIQVYSHVLVALFALYAYWRHKREEFSKSDNYLMLMLATATLPLAVQALHGESGGLYGWWLILEEIAFILIGMAINKRLVIMWGLYVAVGAILYQLRGLGWAALAILAVFLIALAIFKIQKYTDKK